MLNFALVAALAVLSSLPGSFAANDGVSNRVAAQRAGVQGGTAPTFPDRVYVGSPLTPPQVFMVNGIRSRADGRSNSGVSYSGHIWFETEETGHARADPADPWITTHVEPAHAWWNSGQIYKRKQQIYYVYYVEASFIKRQLTRGYAKYKESIKAFPLDHFHYVVYPLYNSRIPWNAIIGWDIVLPDGTGKFEENKVRFKKPDWDAWHESRRAESPQRASDVTDASPNPTTAPDLAAGVTAFQNPLGEQDETSSRNNTWLNSQTCGWFNGTSSLPLTCDKPWSCVTDQGVVACHSYPWTVLHSVCLDYQAQQLGKCTSLGGLTGCCSSAEYPACLTYLWTEPPARSLLACGKTSTVMYMNDRPQFVIDAERTSSSSSFTGAISSTTPSGGSVPTAADPTGNEPADRDTANLAGVVAGAAIGGLLIIAVLTAVIVWLCLRHRRPRDRKTRDRAGDEAVRGHNLQMLSTPGSRRVSSPAPATPAQAATEALPGAQPGLGTPYYAHPPGTAL
ncbi:hypothetical protein PpBr36_03205 [Pyricularia pennisetigena]|uniref:hypothetical protein n=1 Tax=Pyricularia pennisetigena TaxID=1578925 RepID=UPI001152F3B3|nr:hypothetical protein PpBr36_03205 [Pyricularia pennisetigena]TLS31272.1 hypothetical protein PpBr36_03205 [Pyricularia pennisetigena]